MEDNVVIKIENLHKKFCRSIKWSMAYGTMDIARAMLGISYDPGKIRKTEFWSLEDINLEIRKGETFGLVGANGSGKTTLLRLINGIFPPDKGRITVCGSIGALIAVGAGFHPHMTGRENILLNGTILGMSREEVEDKMDDIINFAEIGEFLDAPVSTYSSGMYVRLGFAIAIHSTPDIVLVDEILAVGDSKFQRKCLDKIREMRKGGTTFILVSHNMQNIEAMCDRAVLLHKGKQLMVGTPQEIVPRYELLLQTGEHLSKPAQEIEGMARVKKYTDFGTEEISVKSFKLISQGEAREAFDSDDDVEVEVVLDSVSEFKDSQLWMTFIDVLDEKDEGQNVVCMGVRQKIDVEQGQNRVSVRFDRLGLPTGRYKVAFHVFDDTFTNPYTQGHYGYFTVVKDIPNLLQVSRSTPAYWGKPVIDISSK